MIKEQGPEIVRVRVFDANTGKELKRHFGVLHVAEDLHTAYSEALRGKKIVWLHDTDLYLFDRTPTEDEKTAAVKNCCGY